MIYFYRSYAEGGTPVPGCCDRTVSEEAPGRSALEALLEEAEPGDRIIAAGWRSVADSAKELLAFLGKTEEKRLAFTSLEEQLDTTSRDGQVIMRFLRQLRQLDLAERRQKQQAGIAQAKEEGRYRGRKPIEVDDLQFLETVARWRAGEITATQAMKELNLKPNTFYRRIKERAYDMKNEEQIKAAIENLKKELKIGLGAETEELRGKLADMKDAIASTATAQELDSKLSTLEMELSRRVDVIEKDIQQAVEKYKMKQTVRREAQAYKTAQEEPAQEAAEAAEAAEVSAEEADFEQAPEAESTENA